MSNTFVPEIQFFCKYNLVVVFCIFVDKMTSSVCARKSDIKKNEISVKNILNHQFLQKLLHLSD